MTELYDFYNMFTSHSKKTIIFFKGNFTSEMLHEMAHSLKEHLASLEKKNISRKIFAIFIELAQNIYHYSSEKIDIDDKTMGDGIIHIYKDDGKYIIQSGNTIRIAEKQRIIDKIDKINSLSRKELKDFKKEILRQKRERIGGGFGLIEIALYSKSKINYEFTNVDKDNDFIKIEVEYGGK